MNMWQTYLTFGLDLNTDSTTAHQGAYTHGKKTNDDPETLGFSYPLSLGDQTSSSVKIGMVYPFGQDLYIGWQNGTSYAIDKVSVGNDAYATGTIEFLIYDLTGLA